MQWEKLGLIFGPDERMPWAAHSALTPTPYLLNDETIRVFAGFRDEAGVSRIGFVDVDAADPTQIQQVCERPALDVGLPGTFDDNGVILGDLVQRDGQLWLYYVGFQLVDKVKFLAFTGLATSDDNGLTFQRYSNAPVVDRSDEGLYFRAIHSIIRDGDVWRAYCGVGNQWQMIDDAPYPSYHVSVYESQDGIHFATEGVRCIDYTPTEYRLGRPRVSRRDGRYVMTFTVGTHDRGYHSRYAESDDGLTWTRADAKLGIAPSASGWDSEMVCYPTLIDVHDRTYMFYNGNGYGYDGFGCAVLKDD
jgi:predicted GH43/DUF377 family glycosyl hydrolase